MFPCSMLYDMLAADSCSLAWFGSVSLIAIDRLFSNGVGLSDPLSLLLALRLRTRVIFLTRTQSIWIFHAPSASAVYAPSVATGFTNAGSFLTFTTHAGRAYTRKSPALIGNTISEFLSCMVSICCNVAVPR